MAPPRKHHDARRKTKPDARTPEAQLEPAFQKAPAAPGPLRRRIAAKLVPRETDRPEAPRPRLKPRLGRPFGRDGDLPVEQRFLTGFLMDGSADAGLVLSEAGHVILVKPDGTRVDLTEGGGGGLPPQWSQDNTTGQVVGTTIDGIESGVVLTFQTPADLDSPFTAFLLLDNDGNRIGGLEIGEGADFFIQSSDGTTGASIHEQGQFYAFDQNAQSWVLINPDDGISIYAGDDQTFAVDQTGDMQVGRDGLVSLHVDTHGQTTLGAIDADALASLLIKPTGEGIDQPALVVCQDGNRVVQIAPDGSMIITPGSGATGISVSPDLGAEHAFDAGELDMVSVGAIAFAGGAADLTVPSGGAILLFSFGGDSNAFAVSDDADGHSTVGFFGALVTQQDATDGPSLVAALIAYGLLDEGSSWAGGLALTGWTEDASDPANIATNGGNLDVGDGSLVSTDGGSVHFDDGSYVANLQAAQFAMHTESNDGIVTIDPVDGVASNPTTGPAFSAQGSNGATVALDAGTLDIIDAFRVKSALTLLLLSADSQSVVISDVSAQAGTGNALTWNFDGFADGSQKVALQLGSTGQFTHTWEDDGSYTVPGPVKFGAHGYIGLGAGQYIYVVGDNDRGVTITDEGGLAGTGNAILWNAGDGADGAQTARIQIGSTGQFTHEWAADGSYYLPAGFAAWGQSVPVSQPATPVTLGDVIALLQAYGLSA